MSVRKGKEVGLLSTARAFALAELLCLCAPQTMTDVVGNPEEERRAEFYFQPWAQEAVCRYFYSKVSRGPSPCLSLLGAHSAGCILVPVRAHPFPAVLIGCSDAGC